MPKTVIKTKNRVTAKVTAVLTGTRVEAEKTIFRVPNDPGGEGKAFIRACKCYLNKEDYTIRVRFRGPRKNPNHTLKEDAKWFAIYIDKK